MVRRSPFNGTIFKPRKKFTVTWTIKNSGTASWKKGTIYYHYLGGAKFHDRPQYDLKYILDPGDTIDLKIDMYAPSKTGSYETTWAVSTNTGGICRMTLAIVVK